MAFLSFPLYINTIVNTPINNLPTPATPLKDLNGKLQSARQINPVTKDFVLNPDGTFAGASAVQTAVYLALFTTLNSSAVFGLGNALKSIKIITRNIQNQVTNVIQNALASLVAQGLVNLVSCDVQNNGSGQVSVNVHWQDLSVNSFNQPVQTTNVPVKGT